MNLFLHMSNLKYLWNVKIWLCTRQLDIQLEAQERINIRNIQSGGITVVQILHCGKNHKWVQDHSGEVAKWKEKA